MFTVAVANVPALALAISGDAILAGTTAAAYYSPEAGVLTVVAHCVTPDSMNARAMINGVELLPIIGNYPDIPAHLGVWSGTYFPCCCVPLRVPEMLSIPMPDYPATFRGGFLFLGENVFLYSNEVTEIALGR